jgi:hypothetical protein
MALLFAATASPMAPLDFLVGHCWRGKLPKAGQVDTHCFSRLTDGSLRDHHDVTENGKLLASGDTLYRWDPGAQVIRYTYRDSIGGVLSSVVRRTGDAIDFGTADYRTKDGKSYAIRTRWTVLGATSYQTEMSSPLLPFVKRTTRFDRVD